MPPEMIFVILKELGPEAVASGMGFATESAAIANGANVSFIMPYKQYEMC